GQMVATGGRYLAWSAATWRNNPNRLFLVDPAAGTTRRLAEHARFVAGIDLNDAGDALVTMTPRRGPYSGRTVVRLYPHGRRARTFLPPKDMSVEAQLCGRRLAMFEAGDGRYRLVVRDRPAAPQRLVFSRPVIGRVIPWRSACDERTFLVAAFSERASEGYTHNRLHAYDLGP
ncbi:MAG: hypothetical protein QOI65_1173, partial [Thermoleophilaceae bacterium]|nr:hypothetical protein [Thermoleophilaceae bacterium]